MVINIEKPIELESVKATAVHQLFLAFTPLMLGLLATGILAIFSADLAILLFGSLPKGGQGYVVLTIVLFPFIAATLYTEWFVARLGGNIRSDKMQN